MKANIVTTIREFETAGPGSIHFWNENQSVMIKCPGCGEEQGLPLVVPGASNEYNSVAWDFDGNLESPTLKPSIWHKIPTCGWHGYLTAGEFKG